MLPTAKRLIKKEDFFEVHRGGRRFFADNLEIQVLEKKNGGIRIGFIVGMGFSKKAVERNKMKRELRAIFRREMENIKKDTDIVVVAKKMPVKKRTNTDLSDLVRDILEKSNVIRKK